MKKKLLFGKENHHWLAPFLVAGGALLLASKLPKAAVTSAAKHTGNRLLKDHYDENLWELISAGHRATAQIIVENSLRTQEGKALKRPLGSPRRVVDFDGLIFNIAQLATEPTPLSTAVNTSVILGPQANRPLELQIPLIVSGMAYGLAVSEQAKLAFAKGASLAGTATNSGESGFWAAERKAATKYIVQYHRGAWQQGTTWCKQADMIEIVLGQGARGGIGDIVNYHDLPPKARKLFALHYGENAVIRPRHTGVKCSADYRKIVKLLREQSKGVPIGVKLGAGNELEKDMAIAIEAGVDFIALDGSEAGSSGSEPLIQDAFGLPTLIALCRGAKFLRTHGLQGKISLIISGGLYHPEHFLKALALGADAIYIGTVSLYAITHHALFSALPWEPPTTLVWAKGKNRDKLDINKGAKDLAKYLKSCTEEMVSGVRALGKTAISAVNRSDLAALDRHTAAITGLELAYNSPYVYTKSLLKRPR